MNEGNERVHVSFTLTPDNEDRLQELAALLGTDPDAVVNLVAIMGFAKELQLQLEGARRKALQQGSPYRPIDWSLANKPAPKPTYKPLRWPAPATTRERSAEENRT